MAYDFHYTPTGTGVISGKEVLEQTEDAINDLGNTAISGVQEALDKAEQALTNSENAVDDAQTALNTANNAEGVAIQAQTDVGNLSGTVANIGNRVTTAEGNISNLQGRMTTAEGNITNLQGRMTTAETNIGNLQTAVSTAQATANSAQQTATTARQQSYVFRYSSTAVVPNSTIAYSTIDNTDNIKLGDKILDVDGKLFEITAVDTANQTVTVGSALIDLALDANVVHTSGDETVGGNKTFSNDIIRGYTTIASRAIKGNANTPAIGSNGLGYLQSQAILTYQDSTPTKEVTVTLEVQDSNYTDGKSRAFFPNSNNVTNLGKTGKRWANVYATNYYYGGSEIEFSTKFVTTDTAQTISGNKTFSSNVNVYNSDSTANVPNLVLKNSIAERGATTSTQQIIYFTDKNDTALGYINCGVTSSTISQMSLRMFDANNQSNGFSIRKSTSATTVQPITDNTVNLGTTTAKWSDVQTYKVNNLEPSSLSLPSDRSARIDISSYITNLGNGGNNQYIVPANGYIWLHFTSINSALCYSQTSNGLTNYAQTFVRYSGDGLLYAFFPVRKNDYFIVQIYTASTAVVQNAYFIPCQGNV